MAEVVVAICDNVNKMILARSCLKQEIIDLLLLLYHFETLHHRSSPTCAPHHATLSITVGTLEGGSGGETSNRARAPRMAVSLSPTFGTWT